MHTISSFKIEEEFANVEKDQRIDDFLLDSNADPACHDFAAPRYDDWMVSHPKVIDNDSGINRKAYNFNDSLGSIDRFNGNIEVEDIDISHIYQKQNPASNTGEGFG